LAIPSERCDPMRRPLILVFIGLICGIVIGNYLEFAGNFLLIGLVFSFILLSIVQKKSFCRISFILIFIITAVVGIFAIQKQQYAIRKDNNISQYADSGSKIVEGIIMESPSTYPDKNILIVSCLRIIKDGSYVPAEGKVRLVIPADLSYSYGDFIRFHSQLRKISSFKNPGGFDYELYLNRQGIYTAGFVANKAGIILLRRNAASTIKLLLETFRIRLKNIIYENSPSPQREIIAAMTIGDQTEISDAVRDDFNRTGTSHILSISGLHVSMVAATAFFLISILLKSSEYLMLKLNIIKVAAASSFVLVLLYALIAGMGVTVARSALMASVFLIALMSGKQKDLYNTLALAGLIILIISPEALFDVSFQLSFLAVLSLIYIVPRFSNIPFPAISMLPSWAQNIIHYIYMSILVCIAATIGTLPLIIFYFNRISSVTVIANLIAVPLLGTLSLALAMAFVLSALISMTIAGFFIKLASFFVGISVDIISKLASLSWSSFGFTKPVIPEIIIFYVFIFLLFQFIDARCSAETRKGFFAHRPMLLKYLLLLTLIFLAGDAVYLSLKDSFSRNLRITAIDVAQGSSTLLQLPGGKNMLIDGGGRAESNFDIGKLVIAPYLYHRRISKIDTVVLTHPHPDHLQGLLYIIDNFNVKEVWSSGLRVDDELFMEWEKIIKKKEIKMKYLSAQSPRINVNGVEVSILWPLKPILDSANLSPYAGINDSSLVLKLTFDKISFLITGDISSEVESSLIMSGANLQSHVLFVPHHGSAHSSSTQFIERVACRYALISAGRGNSFHHPHPSTLIRFKEVRAEVFRTDRDGAIMLLTDGTKLHTSTFVNN
jgi:competence protein ComEC